MERWRVNLYIVWFSQIISLMSFGFGMPFIPFYIQELGVTNPEQLKIYVGILAAAPAIGMGIMAPVWGMLADRWGKKLMLLRSLLFGSIVLAGLGMATHPTHLIVFKLAQGLFTGTVTASSALIASNTPSNRLSYALGFLSSSTFIGFSAGPAIGGFIAEGVGYRVSFFVGAAFMLLAFFLIFIAIKEPRKPSSPDGGNKQSGSGLKQILTPSIMVMLLILFFMRISRTVFNPYLPLYIQEMRAQIEGTPRITGIINAVAGLATAASGLTLSRLGDRFNKKILLVVFLVAAIVLSIPLIFANSLWVFTIMLGVLFFAIGGIEPVIMSFTSENVPAEKRGLLFGIQGMVGSMGWAASPMLGSITSIRFSIGSILILIPVFIAFALITTLRLIKKDNKPALNIDTNKTSTP